MQNEQSRNVHKGRQSCRASLSFGRPNAAPIDATATKFPALANPPEPALVQAEQRLAAATRALPARREARFPTRMFFITVYFFAAAEAPPNAAFRLHTPSYATCEPGEIYMNRKALEK
ncbi:MAG TPA: hypothetical protein VGL08_06585 [Paraburkholderia sp.]